MPVILHDYLGKGHDLSKGAFDSVSQTKPGSASKLLAKYMPKDFKISWQELASEYQTTLKSHQPSYWAKLWAAFGKKGLKSAIRHGATAYTVGRPAVQAWIASVAAADPTIGGIVKAAEFGLSKLIEGWGADAGTTRFSAKKGQWLFIESETHFQHRRLGLTEWHYTKPKKKDPPKKLVSLGFFIEPAAKNKVTVFSMDVGKAIEVEVSQLVECDAAVAQRLDADEKLSTLRELYFYKHDGKTALSEVQTQPFFAGRRVLYKGVSYLLLHIEGPKALLEDANGKTIIVDKSSIARDMGDSTPGRYDDGFLTAGANAIYSGQWVFAPARDWIREDYDTEIELAVVNRVAAHDETIVVYAWDGENDYVRDNQLLLLSKAFQELYNSGPFAKFRAAAVKGTRKTKRIALGKRFPTVCIGRSYEDALKVDGAYDPDGDPPDNETPGGETEVKGPQAGNNEKDAVDVADELAAKGIITEVKLEKVTEEEDPSTVNGLVVVSLAIAALAYALYAA